MIRGRCTTVKLIPGPKQAKSDVEILEELQKLFVVSEVSLFKDILCKFAHLVYFSPKIQYYVNGLFNKINLQHLCQDVFIKNSRVFYGLKEKR